MTAPVVAARTGSARKIIADGSDERPGITGEHRVQAPGLPKYLSTHPEHVQLRAPLGLKGWALGRLRLKRLKTCLGRF